MNKPSGKRNNKHKDKKKSNIKFIAYLVLATFIMSTFFSYASDIVLLKVNNLSALMVLASFVAIGSIFDLLGMAVASAGEKSFHSMAAKKVPGAKQSVWLVKNSERVSSFCNDVIGDICGIMSGSVSAVITTRFALSLGVSEIVLSLMVTGTVASLTIGTKAVGKIIAANSSEKVVFFAGKAINFAQNLAKGKQHGKS